MLVTSYVIRNNGGRWTQGCKVCKIRYCHQKSTRPHGFARHWWGPQLIQLQGPNIGIFCPDRRYVSLLRNLGWDLSPETILNRNISTPCDSSKPSNASINGCLCDISVAKMLSEKVKNTTKGKVQETEGPGLSISENSLGRSQPGPSQAPPLGGQGELGKGCS